MRANHLELSLYVQKNEENGQKRNARWSNNFFVSKNVSNEESEPNSRMTF